MNPTLKQLLCSFGLSYDASDEASQAFFDALSDSQKQDIQGRLKAIAAAAKVEADEAATEAGAAGLAAKVAPAVAKLLNKKASLNMNPKIKACLGAHFGLAADASDEDAQKLYSSKKSEVDAKLAAGTADSDPQKAVLAALSGMTAEQVASLAAQATALRANAGGDIGVDNDARLIAIENRRVGNIRALAATVSGNIPETLVLEQIGKNATVEESRTAFLSHIVKNCKPIENLNVRVEGDKKLAALSAAIPDAIMLRAGQKIEKPHELAAGLRHLTVLDMYRHYLVAMGAPAEEVNYMSRPGLVDVLGPRRCARRFHGVAMLAQGTSAFDAVLLDAANKSARQEYQLAPSTWNMWARRGSAPDFKTINRVQLSDVPGLVARKEGGDIKYNVLKNSNESYVLAEYTNGLLLTRQAMINDDLDMFSRIPRAQMQAAKQLEDDVVYAVLTANAAMVTDTVALFDSTHGNLDSATAKVGAPSVTTLGYGRASLRLQTGPKGQHLNLTAKYLLVPAALEALADQFTSVNYVAAAQSAINPFAPNGRTPLTPIVEPRLDATSATQWYLTADGALIDTVECTFLDGEPEPVLKQESDFDTDDMKFGVRHTTAAKALDWRGLYRNNGA